MHVGLSESDYVLEKLSRRGIAVQEVIEDPTEKWGRPTVFENAGPGDEKGGAKNAKKGKIEAEERAEKSWTLLGEVTDKEHLTRLALALGKLQAPLDSTVAKGVCFDYAREAMWIIQRTGTIPLFIESMARSLEEKLLKARDAYQKFYFTPNSHTRGKWGGPEKIAGRTPWDTSLEPSDRGWIDPRP